MKYERVWLFVHRMTRVWPADTYEHVIFWCEVRGNLPFAFAAVRASNDHVDKGPNLPTVEA
jgi:hypothetical protein